MNCFPVAAGDASRYAASMAFKSFGVFATLAALCLPAGSAQAQDAGPAPVPAAVEFPRSTGRDAESGIEYVLISLDGKLVGLPAPTPAPRLTAQCTKHPDGKMHFELLADAGGVAAIRYVPPWRPTKDLPAQPPAPKVTVAMDFRGYMKVKPVKREWHYFREIPGEMHYATPGLHSGNMEEIMFYLQYLKALPTLRLTMPANGVGTPPVVVEFDTAKWQQRVKAEPMCWASSL
jgi:hypothetical protein